MENGGPEADFAPGFPLALAAPRERKPAFPSNKIAPDGSKGV